MTDITIKTFVDVARHAQNLDETIAVDQTGKSNKLLGGRAIGVLPPNTDITKLVNQNLVKPNEMFLDQLKGSLSRAYGSDEIDLQYRRIALAAALVHDNGEPKESPLTAAQVEVVRIELAHRGLGKLEQPGARELRPKSREYLLNIAHYRAGEKKYNKAKKEKKVDSTRSSAPQEKLGDEQIEQLTISAKNTMKKGRLGNLVDRQLARLNKSGIEQSHRKLMESRVVLRIAYEARHEPGIDPFKLDEEIKGAIQHYKEAKEKNTVTAHMNEIQKQCDFLASKLKEHPFSEERLVFNDDALKAARLYAMGWMKRRLSDGEAIVKAIDKTFSKLNIKDVDTRYDAETVIIIRAYKKYSKHESLTKEDVTNIFQDVKNEYKYAENKNSKDKLYQYWREPINDFVMGVYDLVAELHEIRKENRRSPQSPPPPTPNVQRKRVAIKPEENRFVARDKRVPQQANDPRITQQEAYQTIVSLGYGGKLESQLARLNQTITDRDLREQAGELLILQALAGYSKLRKYYSDNNKVQVQSNMVNEAIDKLTNNIMRQYEEGIQASNLNEVTAFWLKDRDDAINEIKIDV